MSESSGQPATPDRGRRLLGDTVVFALGSFSGRLISIILIPLYTYFLTTAEYGVLDLIGTSVDLAMPLVFLCVHEAVLRFAIDPSADRSKILGAGVVVYLAGVAALLIALPVAWFASSGQPLLPFAFAFLVTQSGFTLLGAWARATERVKAYAVAGIVQAAVMGTTNILTLVWLKMGVPGYLLSIIASYVVAGGYLFVVTRMAGELRQIGFDRSLAATMLRYSAPLIPNALMWWLMNASSRYVIAYFHDTAENGLFALASKIPLVLVMLTSVFAQAWQLSAFREDGAADRDHYFSSVFNAYQSVLLPAVALLALGTKPLLSLVVEPTYFDAWRAVPGLLLASLFSSFAGFFGTVFTARRQTRPIFTTSVIAGLATPVLALLLVPRLGGPGASMAAAAGFGLLWGLRVAAVRSVAQISVDWPRLLVACAALVVQAGFMFVPGAWGYVGQLGGAIVVLVAYLPGLRRTLGATRGAMGRRAGS